MPWGQTVSKIGLAIFFFMVASNLHINLFIKLCSLLEGVYCSNCLKQNQPNQNPLSVRIPRERGLPYENLQPDMARIRPDSDHKVIFAA